MKPRLVDRAPDASVADWVQAALRPWPDERGGVPVASLVPDTFDAYVRIPHEVGTLPPDLCATVVDLLGPLTSTPDVCTFAVWTGYGFMDSEARAGPILTLEQRQYVLYRGPVEAAPRLIWDDAWHQAPDLWWPEDRAWSVGSDMDLPATYIGASRKGAEQLLSAGSITVEPSTADARVDAGG